MTDIPQGWRKLEDHEVIQEEIEPFDSNGKLKDEFMPKVTD